VAPRSSSRRKNQRRRGGTLYSARERGGLMEGQWSGVHDSGVRYDVHTAEQGSWVADEWGLQKKILFKL
jgi:hypothetical protein